MRGHAQQLAQVGFGPVDDLAESRLVEPTSMNSTPGSTRWRMALKVASEAATGTAINTMSEPETASRADSAAISITPSRRAFSVVEGDLL